MKASDNLSAAEAYIQEILGPVGQQALAARGLPAT